MYVCYTETKLLSISNIQSEKFAEKQPINNSKDQFLQQSNPNNEFVWKHCLDSTRMKNIFRKTNLPGLLTFPSVLPVILDYIMKRDL